MRETFCEDASKARKELADNGFEFWFCEGTVDGNGLLDCAGWVCVEDCPDGTIRLYPFSEDWDAGISND